MKYEIQDQPGTEVYVSDRGYVCIKQSGGLMEEDSVIVMRPDHVGELCEMLMRQIEDAIAARSMWVQNSGGQDA